MKSLYPIQCRKQFHYKALALFFAGWLIQAPVFAQTAAAWNFNNTLSQTTIGAHVAAPDIIMGTGVPSQAFNSGTEFFGQDGWPSGALDPNAFLQFTVSANAAYFLVLNSLTITMRHSTLGTAAGSGPASWSLRSSLDNYITDVAAGVLTTSYQNYIVSLPTAFQSIPSTVTFRIYGYNEITTAGGSNRFVFDNISVSGQANPGTLAAQSILLQAAALPSSASQVAASQAAVAPVVGVRWQTAGFGVGTDLTLERSVNGADFVAIDRQTITDADVAGYHYEDAPATTTPTVFYRVVAGEPDGSSFRSPIVAVTMPVMALKQAAIRGIVTQGSSIKALLHFEEGGTGAISVRSTDGRALYQRAISASGGDVTADISLPGIPHGLYILTLSSGAINSSRPFIY
jgi:hypothetical protein